MMNGNLATDLKSTHHSILIIGYGNPLRSDDGVGQQIATAVANWRLPDVEAIAVHQLIPELVEELAEADIVIFVDACFGRTKGRTVDVHVQPLTLAKSRITTGHWCEPPNLLAMTQALYNYHPQSWWVMVPGEDFALGECLSLTAKQGMKVALTTIERLIQTARIDLCMRSE